MAANIPPPSPQDPEKFATYLQLLPPKLQDKVASKLSEKEVYTLFQINPVAFFQGLQNKPRLARKFYDYVFSHIIWPTGEQSQAEVSKVSRLISTYFQKEDVKSFDLVDPFSPESFQRYITHLDLKNFEDQEVAIILKNLPDDNIIDSMDISDARGKLFLQLLNKCPNVQHLHLDDPGFNLYYVTDAIPELKFLKSLILKNKGNLNYEKFNLILEKAPNLQSLHLTKLKNKSLKILTEITSMDSLERLHLEELKLGKKSLLQLQEKFPNLKRLDIDNCDEAQIPYLESLEVLNFHKTGFSNWLNEDLEDLVTKVPNLKTLHFSLPSYVPDSCNISLVANLNLLENLSFGNITISQKNFPKFLENPPRLKSLDLTRCHGLEELSFEAISSLNSLETLTLKSSMITKEQLTEILESLPQLKKLDITDCKTLQDFDFSNYPDLEVIGP